MNTTVVGALQGGLSQMALALNTTMLSCELKGLRWRDVEFLGWTITEYSASAAARSELTLT